MVGRRSARHASGWRARSLGARTGTGSGARGGTAAAGRARRDRGIRSGDRTGHGRGARRRSGGRDRDRSGRGHGRRSGRRHGNGRRHGDGSGSRARRPHGARTRARPLTSSNDSAEHPANSYVLRVNGGDRPVTDAWIGESLLYVLRERLGLAGAKDGCSQGECGACNVQVDGRLVASCLVPAATAAGSEVRTVEGLASDGEPSDVQRALANCGAVQCGFCIPGMAMTVHDLLEGNHDPSELETRQALSGNLCRCSGYRGVLDAVGEVVAERAASAEAADEARIPHQAPPGAGGAHPAPLDPHDGGMA